MSINPKNHPLLIYYLFALIFGLIYAWFLSFTAFGRWLALKRTWITVVIGVGCDLLLVRPVVRCSDDWHRFLFIIGSSSLPIIARSLLIELTETNNVINRAKKGRNGRA